MCGAVVYLDANDSHLHYMLYSRMTGCGAELVPLCSLPCSIRFGVWCLRVARLSAQGRELARQRLHEVHALLQRASAASALERCVGLLLEDARAPLDIREFGLGSIYPSQMELDLLAAFGALQAGETAIARGMLANLTTARLAAVVETATAWATDVREAGVNLEWCAGESPR